jgi:oligoribonuclease (3'-5' exoribonuclease)
MPSFAQIPKIATNNISANRPEIELTKLMEMNFRAHRLSGIVERVNQIKYTIASVTKLRAI